MSRTKIASSDRSVSFSTFLHRNRFQRTALRYSRRTASAALSRKSRPISGRLRVTGNLVRTGVCDVGRVTQIAPDGAVAYKTGPRQPCLLGWSTEAWHSVTGIVVDR